MEGGHFDPFGDNDDDNDDNDDNDNDNDNDDDEKSFLKALQLRWGALKNTTSQGICYLGIYLSRHTSCSTSAYVVSQSWMLA